MGSEMGNNNVSGIKEEETATVEVAENAQEAVAADEVKGENHEILGDQTKDFHAKGEELSSNGLSAANDLDAERHESNEQEIGGTESKHHSQSQDSSPESNNLNSQESNIQKLDSPDDGNYVKPLESNLEENIFSSDIPQIHDQPSIEKETETKEVERTDPADSKTTSQPSKSSNHSTRSLEVCQCLPSKQSEEVTNMSDTCNLEEKENAQEGIESEEHIDDLVTKETHIVEDELQETNTGTENCDSNSTEKENAQEGIESEEHIDDLVTKETHIVEDELQETNTGTENCDSNSTENKFGDGLEGLSDGQVPLRRNLIEFSDSSTEVALQNSLLDPSVATLEPQEKRVIHAEEIDLISIKSEEGANKQESSEINSPEQQTVNNLIINTSAPSVIQHEVSSKENGKEVVQIISSSGLERIHLNGEAKVTLRGSKSVMAGNKSCVSFDQFEDIAEDIKTLPSITSVSTQLSSTDKHDAEEKATGKTSLEETEKDVSSSMEINNDDRGTSEECLSGSESFKWEGSLLETSSASQLNSQNSNATLLGYEAAEDTQNCTVIKLEERIVNATSNLDAHKATMQIRASSSALESFKPEPEKNIQTTSGTSAETESLSNWSNNQQCPSGEMSHLSNVKAQESSARLSIESNPGHPGNQFQRSKSPSFDFGLQLDAKSEDSDQTPLLHHDKTAARSFSGFANVRFQNRIIQTDYGRKSLDFEPVAVEEKTIRMERSDSDISRASFMNLLKKDEKGANAQFSPKKQESPPASNNSEESTEELALTSVKGSGKRKSRSSIFTSCICCTASVH